MTWSTQHLMKRTKDEAMKRTMLAGVVALTLLLAAASTPRVETVTLVSWSWGETQGGTFSDPEDPGEHEELPSANGATDKASPKLN